MKSKRICNLCKRKSFDNLTTIADPVGTRIINICDTCVANLNIAFWNEYHRIQKKAGIYNI